ncbi:MAG TPA: type II toxin-antitoxin system prevent-host-death family antitoxin [Chloroflexota bacterium]|nr:type II toxin-antitoxin system prevent-host-death family antitoxin [Chloroflexota bacterium]
MAEQVPRNQVLNATEVRAHWSQVLLDVFHHKSRVVVNKGGIPVAAIIAADDLKRFERIERERAERFQVIAEGWEAFQNIDLGEVDAEVAEAVAEARAEIRAERDAHGA